MIETIETLVPVSETEKVYFEDMVMSTISNNTYKTAIKGKVTKCIQEFLKMFSDKISLSVYTGLTNSDYAGELLEGVTSPSIHLIQLASFIPFENGDEKFSHYKKDKTIFKSMLSGKNINLLKITDDLTSIEPHDVTLLILPPFGSMDVKTEIAIWKNIEQFTKKMIILVDITTVKTLYEKSHFARSGSNGDGSYVVHPDYYKNQENFKTQIHRFRRNNEKISYDFFSFIPSKNFSYESESFLMKYSTSSSEELLFTIKIEAFIRANPTWESVEKHLQKTFQKKAFPLK